MHSFEPCLLAPPQRPPHKHTRILAGVFSRRVGELRRWLLARPEQCIAVVAHWGLLMELTHGADFANCQIQTYQLSTNGKLRQVLSSKHASVSLFR
jgi:hypothetical protein